MFRAVTFSEYRPGSSGGLKGDVYSNQNDNGYHPNNVYYFKYEPLTWRVLDPDEGYIMCDNAIDSQAFQNFVIKKEISFITARTSQIMSPIGKQAH